MSNRWARWARLASLGAVITLSLSSLVMAAGSAPSGPVFAETVTVLVEVTLAANTEPAEALAALNEMRDMMRRQPGYLSEAFLQNLNPGNSPRYVHLSRWASLAHWASVFRTPEFNQISAHGPAHYVVSTSAFLQAD
jgi:heme-degrading monooxygenase HmoA